jgi:tetratricopeptide (TPR) repeat protein
MDVLADDKNEKGPTGGKSPLPPLLSPPKVGAEKTTAAPLRAVPDDPFIDGEVRPPTRPTFGRRSVTRRSRLGIDDAELEAPPERVRLAPRQLVPGTRYKLARWLGDGGMGVVYEAVHVDLDRRAALKILRPNLTRSPGAVKAFRDEARAVNRVGSRNVVEIYDFAELSDGRLLFAMELLDGPTLADVVDEGEVFSVERTIAITRQLCRGLAAVHDAGIVHRDVKPQNVVLVQEEGRPDMAKILDFGISSMLSNEEQGPSAAGTVVYMAPEQIEGRPADPKLDQYALGCTIYEMLTGDPPFMPETVEELLDAHRHQEPEPPSLRRPGIPAEIDRIVLRCLAKDPAERFTDMRDIEASLCEAQLALRLHTPWDDLPIPDVAAERRDAIQQAFARARVPEAPRKPRWKFFAAAGVAVVLAIGGGVYIGASGEVPLEARNEIEDLTFSARTAASRAFFVYPPAEDPAAPTAYAHILKLEGIQGDAEELADSRAGSLRLEFAGTLVRLGDEYWLKDGGEPFALDYYAQALVFEPENERAKGRASLTPGELASLRRKAGTGEFSENELAAAEPLIALAEPDIEVRVDKLTKLRKKRKRRSASTEEKLDRLLASDMGKSKTKVSKRKTPSNDAAATAETPNGEPVGAGDPTATTLDAAQATGSPRPAEKDTRNPTQARELARQGQEALARNKYRAAETLFSRALSHDNQNTSALVGLSDVHFERGAYRKAVGFAKRAVALSPRNGGYRIRLGDAYFKVMRYKDARTEYVKARQLGHGKAKKRISMVDKKLGQ